MNRKLGLFIVGHHGPWFHGVGDQAVIDQLQLDDMVGRGKGAFGTGAVPEFPIEGEIVRNVIMNQRLPDAGGSCRTHGCRQRLVIDVDQFGGVLGLYRGFRDDEGDMVADMAHPILAEHRAKRVDAGAAVPVFHRDGAGQLVGAVGRDVVLQDDGQHAGCGFGSLDVDALDARMGLGRAHHHAVSLTIEADVVGIPAASGDESLILDS